MTCPICLGKGVIHERTRAGNRHLYVLRPCWACTPQPIRPTAA